MLFKLIIIKLFLSSFVIAEKSLTIVLDVSGSMNDEINIIYENIGPLLSKIKNKNINNYIFVPYSDPNVGPVYTSLTQDGLVDAIKTLEMKYNGDCLEISLKAIEKALESSKPESYIYVFTDAQAKDYNRLKDVQSLCRMRRSQVFIFQSGKCLDNDIVENSEDIYFEIAKHCNGSFFHMDIRNFRKALWLINDISNVDWTEVNTPSEFTDYKKIMFTIDSYTENLIVAVSCQSPKIEILNDLNARPEIKTIMYTDRALIVNVIPVIGAYSIDIICRGPATATIYTRKTIRFEYGFSPIRPHHLGETSSRPLPNIASNILIALPGNSDAEIISIILQYDVKGTTQQYEAIDEEKRNYIAEYTFQPNYSYKILIFCKDRVSGIIVSGQSDTIIAQQSVLPEKSVYPSFEKTLLVPPVIDYGTNFTLSCKVIAYPEPEIWWENEHGEKLPSEHALLETPFVYISYVTIDNAAQSSNVSCKSKNLAGENTVMVEYYVNRTNSFDIIQTPSDTTIEYGNEGKLYCEVNAYPEAQTKWYHNGTIVEYSENIQVMPEEHMLRINRMSLDDAGEYKCEVSNEVESQTFTASVFITGLEPPQIEIGNTEIILTPGDRTELTCNVIKGTPIPEVTWKYKVRLGGEYEDTPHGVIFEANSFRIESATVKHAGIYVCEATNMLGLDAAEATVKVQYAPVIKNGDEMKTVKNTHPVELACDVDAVPPANVRWDMYQDDVIIAFDERHWTDQDHTHHFIASAKDSGMYHCIAENSMGRTIRTVTINVLVKPYIEHVRSRIRVRTGDSVTIPCKVLEGNPVPATRLEFTDKNSIKTVLLSTNSTGKLELFIKDVGKRNAGTYQCVAESTAGFDTVTVDLKVDSY